MTQNKSVLIIYEVVLNVNRLVMKSNPDLSTSAWDSIMDITKAAMDHVKVCKCKCKNVTDTISWQGHHNRVMQLN